jgi:hypothetical protein
MDSDEVSMALLWSLYGVGMGMAFVDWHAEGRRTQGETILNLGTKKLAADD